MSRQATLGKDAITLTASKIIANVLTMMTAMLLARVRTLEENGTYSQLLLVINLVTSILMLGLPNSINFFLAKVNTQEERNRFLSVYYTLSTLLSAVVGITLTCLMPCWETFFSHMSYSGFQKVWDGTTWKGIMYEVYTIDNINYYKHCTSLPGEKNGNALYTDKEVLDARCYYVHHTLQETYDKYHKNNQTKVSFRHIIDQGYKHLPIYSKLKKEWTLKGEKIDFTYKPVSTIFGSEE